MPQPVLDAITNHLLLEADIGGYEAEAEAADAIEGSRSSLAQLLGAPTDRVGNLVRGVVCACRGDQISSLEIYGG